MEEKIIYSASGPINYGGTWLKRTFHKHAVTTFQNVFLRKDSKRRRILKIMAHSRLTLTVKDINELVFRRVCKIVESDYLLRYVCLSVCTHGTTWIKLEGFS
jgi:hypothetical protein